MRYLVVQYLGVLKVNLWDYKGNIGTQKRLKVTYSTTKGNSQYRKLPPQTEALADELLGGTVGRSILFRRPCGTALQLRV